MIPKKTRLDLLVFEKGLCESREKARRLILAGKVLIDGKVFDKPGVKVAADGRVELKPDKYRFVSRGGEKIAPIIEKLKISIKDKVCADIGASTGGFTDCLLKKGAKKVYAIDVGREQLHEKVAADPRVAVMDKVNARYLSSDYLPEKIDIISIDVSFISLKLIIPPALKILKEDGIIIALAKPQFEAGREKVPKSGVVKDKKVHKEVIRSLSKFIEDKNCKIIATEPSQLTGAKGNIEYFIVFNHKGTKTQSF